MAEPTDEQMREAAESITAEEARDCDWMPSWRFCVRERALRIAERERVDGALALLREAAEGELKFQWGAILEAIALLEGKGTC